LVARSLAKHVERDKQGHALGGKRHPTVGDDVTIYAGATIVGGDTVIGDRTIIGGNVWLTRSIPPDSVVFFEAQQVSIHSRQRMGGDWVI
jgi:serine O-acetyltransferase